jgi:ABC-type nitrate/sulfonate/bicarbonate transport system permease component
MLRLLLRSVILVAALTATSACDDNEITTPTLPTPDPITETFSGAINPNGAATHTFSATTAGNVTATLTAVGPDSATVIGFSLGYWNGTSCTTVTASDAAQQPAVLYGTATQAGQFCVRVYDVGRFTENTTYEITVVHP